MGLPLADSYFGVKRNLCKRLSSFFEMGTWILENLKFFYKS
jgi:hypothetical protein